MLALGVGPRFAAKDCGRQIIDDWFKDGRVDKIYPLHCYEDALSSLPNDVRTYSDAPQAIQRALPQALAQGAPVDGRTATPASHRPTPTETTPNSGDDDRRPTRRRPTRRRRRHDADRRHRWAEQTLGARRRVLERELGADAR